jgi:hypothetical protein
LSKVSVFDLDSDAHQFMLAIVFLIAVFIIYFKIQVTLMQPLRASQFLLFFGLVGFGLTFILRKRFYLTAQDGLFYGTFLTAPILMAFLLSLNGLCANTEYEETYRIVSNESVANGYELKLENDAYAGFWQILTVKSLKRGHSTITFTFCDGLFGYKEIRHIEMCD